ncbi:MAG TPA: exodeoxyribonuclease VII large subunit, partial [Longimicrobium sp.]|nr:exodeoxyribonuclease VII large subunit [Longimicrobium sp.]
MTWDLFTSAAEAAKQPPLNEARNEDAARRVAAQQADAGFPDLLDALTPAAPAASAKTAGTKSTKAAKSGKRGRSAKSALLAALGRRPAVDAGLGIGMEDELGDPLDLAPDAGVASAGRAPEGGWTPSTLNAAARHLIEGMFPPLWVSGEISNFTRARSGHCYFSLRDRDSQIRCVMWRDEARRLPTQPAEGMEVRVLGRLTIYEGRGEFQLVVAELEGRGEGLWKLAFDRLRVKLETEGLTAPHRKRPIPAHPACVGVVTSSAGAALRDVISVIRRRAPWTRIVLSAARVQGEGAAAEIAAAIRRIGAAGCADVLIVGRGGGSTEDLWAFNEEVVARAIAESPVPVISAVGHETDFTIADLVADLRAPTPSAAAEAAVPDRLALRRELAELRDRMVRCTRDSLDGQRERLFEARLDLRDAGTRVVGGRRDAAAALAGRLNALSPLSTLARGFAVPLDPAGRVLRRTADFAPGDAFRLRVVDGMVE